MHMCDYYLSIYHDFYAFKFNNTYDKIQLGLEVFATTSYVLILISLQPIVLLTLDISNYEFCLIK